MRGYRRLVFDLADHLRKDIDDVLDMEAGLFHEWIVYLNLKAAEQESRSHMGEKPKPRKPISEGVDDPVMVGWKRVD